MTLLQKVLRKEQALPIYRSCEKKTHWQPSPRAIITGQEFMNLRPSARDVISGTDLNMYVSQVTDILNLFHMSFVSYQSRLQDV